ncbi:MAG: hypothetical protein EXR79_00530 [Myxococcales bacterium]|nr:hypothetical protein [Myxococcales bacterium]
MATACGCAVTLLAAAGGAQVPGEGNLPDSAPLRTQDLPDAQKRSRSVAVLPLRDYTAQPADLFAIDGRTDVDARGAALEAALAAALSRHPYLHVQSAPEVRAGLAADPGTAALARAAQGRYRLGLDLYLSLATGRAADSLREAIDLYRGVFQDVIDPKPYADAQFMYGVALHELGKTADAHVALKRAFEIEPHRRFRANFFPAPVNAALANALVDFRSTAGGLQPFGDNDRLTALAKRLGTSWVVQLVLRAGRDGPELHASVFSVQRRLIAHEARLRVPDVDDALDAFVSRWLACAPVLDLAPTRPPRTLDVRLDTSTAYAMYQRVPTRRAFHSVGFGVGVSHEFRRGLDWFARTNMYTSLPDPYRDLLHAFNSVRVLFGLGFAVDFGPVRIVARPSVDLHLLGSFVASRDPNCKLFGVKHALCDTATVSDLDQRVLAGFNFAFGSQIAIGREFFVHTQASLSSYFLPLSGTDRLNFPLSGEAGLGYRF